MPIDYEPAGMNELNTFSRPSVSRPYECERYERDTGVGRQPECTIVKSGQQFRGGIAGALRANEKGAARFYFFLHDGHTARAVC